jgi:hypothetical protein
MTGREAVRGGVLGQFFEPQRVRVADEFAEDAVPRGQRADRPDLFVGEPHRQELRQPLLLPDHTQSPVLGVHQHHRGLDDPAQHLGQIQLAADRQHGLKEALHPVPGAADLLDADLQLVQQGVELQPWQRSGTLFLVAAHPHPPDIAVYSR